MTILRFRMPTTLRPPLPAPLTSGKSDTKNFRRFIPRNPLISLDSDERIQGNPRKSNPHNRGFSERNGPAPRKSKRIDRTDAGGCRGSQALRPKSEARSYLTSEACAPRTAPSSGFGLVDQADCPLRPAVPVRQRVAPPGAIGVGLKRGCGSADWDDGRLALSIRSAPSPPDQRSVTHVREPVRKALRHIWINSPAAAPSPRRTSTPPCARCVARCSRPTSRSRSCARSSTARAPRRSALLSSSRSSPARWWSRSSTIRWSRRWARNRRRSISTPRRPSRSCWSACRARARRRPRPRSPSA